MKTLATIIIVLIFTISGCTKRENIANPINNPPKNSNSYLVEGKVVAVFVDTVSQESAESFLLAHNLSVFVLLSFDKTPPHSGVIDVPIGQEEAWIDTLQKYPVIKSTDRLGVMEIAN